MAWDPGDVRYFIGTAAPTVNDDENADYRESNVWVDTTNDKAYVCIDATATAAVWTEITGAGSGVAENLFNANTILKADVDNTPAALTVAEQTLVGRITSGVITALTAAQVRTLLGVADGADVTADNAPKAHKASHTDGSDDIRDATDSLKGLATSTQITKLDTIATNADVTADNAPSAHTASHTDGTDDIQSATNAQKGVATAAHITALELATSMENNALSPMIITGGTITEGTTGTFTVAALTAYLRTTDSLTGALAYVTLAEQANQTITAADTTYIICLDYNGGTPQIVLSTTNPYTRT